MSSQGKLGLLEMILGLAGQLWGWKELEEDQEEALERNLELKDEALGPWESMMQDYFGPNRTWYEKVGGADGADRWGLHDDDQFFKEGFGRPNYEERFGGDGGKYVKRESKISKLDATIRDWKKDLEKWSEAQRDRMANIQHKLEARKKEALKDWEGMGQFEKAKVMREAAGARAGAGQELAKRGLTSATLASNRQAGVTQDEKFQKLGIEEMLTKGRVNLNTGLTGDIINSLQGQLGQEAALFGAKQQMDQQQVSLPFQMQMALAEPISNIHMNTMIPYPTSHPLMDIGGGLMSMGAGIYSANMMRPQQPSFGDQFLNAFAGGAGGSLGATVNPFTWF